MQVFRAVNEDFVSLIVSEVVVPESLREIVRDLDGWNGQVYRRRLHVGRVVVFDPDVDKVYAGCQLIVDIPTPHADDVESLQVGGDRRLGRVQKSDVELFAGGVVDDEPRRLGLHDPGA